MFELCYHKVCSHCRRGDYWWRNVSL